jgi:DegV family protein with EDD domain
MTVGLCTDSSSQIPQDLVERFGVEVVPITVTIDDEEYLEGVDLDADAFFALFADGRCPTVTTSQPSPGQFALAYEALADRGCTEILSIHVAASISGTLNSGRLAAHRLGLPVRLVDSGSASFGIACCVWAAGEALSVGASLDEAAILAETLAPDVGNIFISGALDQVRRGGLAGETVLDHSHDGEGVPVLTLRDGRVEVVERVATVVDAVNSMAAAAIRWGSRLNVAVGVGDRCADPIADALAAAVGETSNVEEVIRYRLGPSVGAHTGPGTVGCFMFPSVLARSIPTAN